MRVRQVIYLVLLAAVAAGPQAAQEQQQPPAQPQPTAEKPLRTVVTLDGKLADLPELTPGDFQIEAGKKKSAPTRVFGPSELPTLLAIVLQDNQTPAFGAQLPALRDFILALPPKTYVALFYLTGQTIDSPFPAPYFDSDLKKVADALRAPRGTQESAPPSPYDKVTQLVDFMNRLADARKEILLFSEGSDAVFPNTVAVQNRSLIRAVNASRQTGIPVWVIYTEAIPPQQRLQTIESDSAGQDVSGMNQLGQRSQNQGRTTEGSGRNASQDFSSSPLSPTGIGAGLTYLDYLADRSGAKVFSSGKFAVDIRPFLEQFQGLLGQQFVLEYTGPDAVKKVKLNRKLKGVTLLAPED